MLCLMLTGWYGKVLRKVFRKKFMENEKGSIGRSWKRKVFVFNMA